MSHLRADLAAVPDAAMSAELDALGVIRGLRRELTAAFIVAGLITLFVNLGLLFVPIYDMILYDRILQSKNMDTLTVLTIGVAAGMTLYGIIEFCRSSVFLVMADRLARRLNLPALQAAVIGSLGGGGSTGAQAMRDINELRLFVAGPASAIPLDLLWTPGLVAVLFLLHPAYGVYGLLCAAILFGLSLVTDLWTREDLLQANTATTRSLNELSAALRKSELLEGMGMLPDVARRWHRDQGEVLDLLRLASRRNKACAALAKVARLAMQAGIIALGVMLVLRNEASPGSMMGSNLLVAKLLLPFEQLVTGWRQWTAALAAWRRVRDLLLAARQPKERAAPYGHDGRLVVDGLSFTPPGATRAVFRDLSFVVEPGEAVGIVGPSGAGKSSLARLIAGIFPPSAGAVLFDGVPTVEWDRVEFGRRVGYLPQSVALLDGTVLDNIRRMQDDDPALAVDAATRAGVHELIGRLPEGYATWIGGAGYALSGGQQQQVALARALYGQPKLLILDEPNSSLDHVGEQALVGTITEAKREGAAILVITHRPAVLAALDRTLILKDGRIEPGPDLAPAAPRPVVAEATPEMARDARGQLASA
jgi:ATP-binding cassette, subfamily C, bacterial